jgi:holo-[acyl-carrier protein] synthase
VRVSRIENDLSRFGARFAQRILCDRELTEFEGQTRKAHFLARRFAVKEAAAKAMGTGFNHGVTARDIGVTHDANGKPDLEFSGGAFKFIREHQIAQWHVSLADEEDHAVAFVTLEIR